MSLRPPLPGHLRTDPVAINELLVGLPQVVVLGAAALDEQAIELHVMRRPEPTACTTCGVPARFKGWRDVVLADASIATRRVALHWHTRRRQCVDTDCPAGDWTERDDRKVFEVMVPTAALVADPFDVTKLANTKLDECRRRRVQNETLGHRGRKSDPLYRCRRLLTRAKGRLDPKGKEKLKGLLRAGDPRGDVATMHEAKEAVREVYAHADPDLALEWVTQLGQDLQDADYPVEARSLGRTHIRWRHQIAAWHRPQVSNGPTEAANNLIKRVKRAAFGFVSFRNYWVRVLLYAGKPNWALLDGITLR